MNSVRLAPTPASVSELRSMLRVDLAVLPEPVREDVALVASELLGNAVLHAVALEDGRFAIDWGVGEAGVEIAVTDGGSVTAPQLCESGAAAMGGRGLAIVANIATRWGVEQADGHTTVWALVPVVRGYRQQS